MHVVVVYERGDHGDDPPTNRVRELWPSVHHELYFEWGLCGGRVVSGVGADLSEMLLIRR